MRPPVPAPPSSRPSLSEGDFRKRIQEAYDRIEAALHDVDPDVAECEQAMGSMTISFADRSRCILSAQPSVRQLWLALAALGTAHHFNFDPEGGLWWDDKGRNIELLSFLQDFLAGKTGQAIRI